LLEAADIHHGATQRGYLRSEPGERCAVNEQVVVSLLLRPILTENPAGIPDRCDVAYTSISYLQWTQFSIIVPMRSPESQHKLQTLPRLIAAEHACLTHFAVRSLADSSLVFAISEVWVQICFVLIHGKTSDYSEEPSRGTLRLYDLFFRPTLRMGSLDIQGATLNASPF